MANSQVHWGDWLDDRSQYVGFKRKRDLSQAVGCSSDQLTKWLQMAQPPKSMRKGYDKKLASALEVTSKVLFKDYLNIPPSQAGFIAELPGPGKEPWKGKEWPEMETDKKLSILAYMLGNSSDDVSRLIDFGIALVEAKDSRELRKWSFTDGALQYDGSTPEQFEALNRPKRNELEADLVNIDQTLDRVSKALKTKANRSIPRS